MLKNKFRGILSCLMITLVLSGCYKRGEPVSALRTGDFQVETLFVHEGCIAYRFMDGLRPVYFVRCPQGVQTRSLEAKNRNTQVQTINF